MAFFIFKKIQQYRTRCAFEMLRLFSALTYASGASSHATLTNRRPRKQPFVTCHHQAGIDGVLHPAKQLPGLTRTSSTSTKEKAQASRRGLGDKRGQRRIFCALFSDGTSSAVFVFFGDVDTFSFLPVCLVFAPCGRLQPRKSCLRNTM